MRDSRKKERKERKWGDGEEKETETGNVSLGEEAKDEKTNQ